MLGKSVSSGTPLKPEKNDSSSISNTETEGDNKLCVTPRSFTREVLEKEDYDYDAAAVKVASGDQ